MSKRSSSNKTDSTIKKIEIKNKKKNAMDAVNQICVANTTNVTNTTTTTNLNVEKITNIEQKKEIMQEQETDAIKENKRKEKTETKEKKRQLGNENQNQMIPECIIKEIIKEEKSEWNRSSLFDIENEKLFTDMSFELIKAYYGVDYKRTLVRHQLESFNYFITKQMPETIEQFNPIIIQCETEYNKKQKCNELEIYLYLENTRVGLPIITESDGSTRLMYPAEAELKNFTYGSKVTVDVRIQYLMRFAPDYELIVKETVFPNIIICNRMPIMVKSVCCLLSQNTITHPRQTGECEIDCGGYFIIKGSEKTVLTQVRISENEIHVFYDKNSTATSWFAEIHSVPGDRYISPKTTRLMIQNTTNIYGNPITVVLSRFRQPIPLCILMRYLGVVTDKEIVESVVYNIEDTQMETIRDYMEATIFEGRNWISYESAEKYICDKLFYKYPEYMTDPQERNLRKIEYLQSIMATDLLPHCPTHAQKAVLLGIMARKLIKTALGYSEPSDRDSYNNKRFDTTGNSLNNLFRNNYNQFVKSIRTAVLKEVKLNHWKQNGDPTQIITMNNISKIIKSTPLENGIKRPLASGDFSLRQSSGRKVGVAQMLSRLTQASTISHLRRINAHVTKKGEMISPRKLHPTSYGFVCPVETPEGEAVGIVTSLSSLAHITQPFDHNLFLPFLRPHLCWVHTDEQECFIFQKEQCMKQIQQLHPPTPIDPSITERKKTLGYQFAIKEFRKKLYQTTLFHLNKYYSYKTKQMYNKVLVFINGIILGYAKKPMEFYQWLCSQKESGILSIYSSICFKYADKEIHITTDGGRITRPVLRMNSNNGKTVFNTEIAQKLINKEIKFDDLLTNSVLSHAVIEYIDPYEQNQALIGMPDNYLGNENIQMTQYTHCEIHPSTMFGIVASLIPFPDHNQAPRNAYQCAMGKQSMGIFATNYDCRIDKTSYLFSYPERPLVSTRMADILHMNETPSGTQVTIAIASYTGYNQEDSIIINKSSIDRGLFSASILHAEKDEEKSQQDSFIAMKPDPEITRGMRFGKLGKYDKLDESGFVPEGTLVENNDIIFGKVVRIKRQKGDNNDQTDAFPQHKYEDHSKKIKTHEPVYIYKNYSGRNGDNYNFAHVQTLTYRKPVIGDKFASRQAQKGTCGNILAEENMPFMADGTKPDIILNPHAIPSRMTISFLKETLMGKVLVELGLFGDGTSFVHQNIQDIASDLQKLGYESYGNEVMYNGMTGQQMETAIFTGPIYYQRLKHMVHDKQHARERGPPVCLTRQPLEGRSRDGGFRIGEMERDVLISHGATSLCVDRLLDVSDQYTTWICDCCGRIAPVNPMDNIKFYVSEQLKSILQPVYKCLLCCNTTSFSKISFPYACKLFFQELEAAYIFPRIITQNSIHTKQKQLIEYSKQKTNTDEK